MFPFSKKVKKEWLIRTDPPCEHNDCEFYMDMEWKLDNYSGFTGAVHPYLVTCLMCSEFNKTNCFIKKN
jgi:hypothetical protein